MLSIQSFLCLPVLRFPSTVPCRMVFNREVCLVTWSHQVSPIRRVSCSPAWVVNSWTRLFIALQYLVVFQEVVHCCHMLAGEDFSFDVGIVETENIQLS